MASRISAVGFVTVSLRRSMGRMVEVPGIVEFIPLPAQDRIDGKNGGVVWDESRVVARQELKVHVEEVEAEPVLPRLAGRRRIGMDLLGRIAARDEARAA